MPNLLGRLWKQHSPRTTQKHRQKPFRTQLKSLCLYQWRSTTVSNFDSSGFDNAEMTTNEGEVEDEGAGEFKDASYDAAAAYLGDVEEEAEDDDEDYVDEISYDANETLEIFDDFDKESDMLSMRFEQQMVSSREELIREESVKHQQKLIEGWADDTVELSLRLETRSLYPILPRSWWNDFPFLSRHLLAENEDGAYLSPFARSSVQDAFKILFSAVRNMRVNEDVGFGQANVQLWRHVRTYINRTNVVAKLRNDLRAGTLVPLLITKWARQHQSMEDLAVGLMQEFLTLSSRLLTILRKPQNSFGQGNASFPLDPDAYIIPPPTLFGIVVHKPVVSILAYEAPSTHPKLREIAYLHTSSHSYEMWNVLGIAVTAAHCSSNMLRIKYALQTAGLYVPPPPLTDPDE